MSVMDPNTTLAEMRDAAHTVRRNYLREDVVDAAVALAERFTALDEWITRGGFLPDAWQRPDMSDDYAPDATERAEHDRDID